MPMPRPGESEDRHASTAGRRRGARSGSTPPLSTRWLAWLVERAHPRWLAFAVLLQAATYLAEGAIWRSVVRAGHGAISVPRAYALSVVKLFMDQTVPTGGLSGTILYVQGLQHSGVPRGVALAGAVVLWHSGAEPGPIARHLARALLWQVAPSDHRSRRILRPCSDPPQLSGLPPWIRTRAKPPRVRRGGVQGVRGGSSREESGVTAADCHRMTQPVCPGVPAELISLRYSPRQTSAACLRLPERNPARRRR
jgi:hypothetical protein